MLAQVVAMVSIASAFKKEGDSPRPRPRPRPVAPLVLVAAQGTERELEAPPPQVWPAAPEYSAE